LQQLIDEVVRSHQPIVIMGAGSNAVLLSEEDWSNIQATLALLSIPSMRESIQAGLATSLKACDGELDW
jgi:antitoxin YefM